MDFHRRADDSVASFVWTHTTASFVPSSAFVSLVSAAEPGSSKSEAVSQCRLLRPRWDVSRLRRRRGRDARRGAEASLRSSPGCCVSAGCRIRSWPIAFLNPSLDHLHDPMLLADMGVAVERILAAIARKERIAIHGDYDVDGVTSTVILRRALELLGGRRRALHPRAPARTATACSRRRSSGCTPTASRW